MRRLVVAIKTGSIIALVIVPLFGLSIAQGSDENQHLPSVFTSPIDPPALITGTVFGDIDGDGVHDVGSGESGISSVTITLGDSMTTTTTADGAYSFCVAWKGHYTLTAVTPAGYTNTTPESSMAHVTAPGQEIEVNFGYRVLTHLPLVAKNYP